MKKLIYILFTSVIFIGACEKGDLVENTEYTKINTGDPSYSFVRFINLTPSSPSVNYYLNNVRSSGNATTTGLEAGFGYLTLFPLSGGSFIPAKVGSNNIKANIVSSAAADANLSVFEATINTEAEKYYTLFTTGEYNAAQKKIESSFLLEEVRPALDTTKVFVKVVNLGIGAASVDFVQVTNPQKIITNIAYGASSDFVELPTPGRSNVYSFTNNTTNATLTSTLSTGTVLTKGYAYTFILRGVTGSTTFPLGVSFYTTFY